MSPIEKEPSTFGWLDTPWIVAALLGVWGAMIGVEEFFVANVFMGLAGIAFVVRLFRDSMQTLPRRIAPFLLGLVIASTIVGADFYFTGKKKQATEERNQEIPGLKGQITGLNGQLANQETARKIDQKASEQKLDDIEGQNKDLKKSVETKDAALVQIAKDQYALNFFPQILISTNGTTDSIYVSNNGKTNIEQDRVVIEGIDSPDVARPQTIAPGGTATFKLTETAVQTVLAKTGSVGKVSVEGTMYLTTLDKRRYSIGFTYYFEVSDGKINKSYITDRAIVEEK
jgi:hypothetical protein